MERVPVPSAFAIAGTATSTTPAAATVAIAATARRAWMAKALWRKFMVTPREFAG